MDLYRRPVSGCSLPYNKDSTSAVAQNTHRHIIFQHSHIRLLAHNHFNLVVVLLCSKSAPICQYAKQGYH